MQMNIIDIKKLYYRLTEEQGYDTKEKNNSERRKTMDRALEEILSTEKLKLDHISLSIVFTKEEYAKMLLAAHFNDESLQDWDEILQALGKQGNEPVFEAEAYYGVLHEKNVLGLITLGECFDDAIAGFEEAGEILKAYETDYCAMEILKKSYVIFGNILYKNEGKYAGALRFLGEEHMKHLPAILERLQVEGVSCNPAFALIPQKTVAFMTELSCDKIRECFHICNGCDRIDCPSRQEEAPMPYGYERILGGRNG